MPGAESLVHGRRYGRIEKLLAASFATAIRTSPVLLNPNVPDRFTKSLIVALNPVTSTLPDPAATFSVFVIEPTVTDAAEADVSLL